MTLEEARGIAARCWCDPTTEHLVMIPELCEVLARTLMQYTEKYDQALKSLSGLPEVYTSERAYNLTQQ